MLICELSSKPMKSMDANNPKLLSGIFTELDTWNQNTRRYKYPVYESAYQKIVSKIKERKLLGELDHPIDYDEVRLSNVSHVIVDCRIVDRGSIKVVEGTIELLDTPSGLIAQALNKAGVPLGISSRGMGELIPCKEGTDVKDYTIITYDLVADPSFANAYLNKSTMDTLDSDLKYVESKLPVTESKDYESIRNTIKSIRESIINRPETSTGPDVDNKVANLESIVESQKATIESDTKVMKEHRTLIKSVKMKLDEANRKNSTLTTDYRKLKESYNELATETDNYVAQISELNETILDLNKRLLVERRGLSYDRVSKILEGATDVASIERTLDEFIRASRKTSPISDKKLSDIPINESTSDGKYSLSRIIASV